jgi:hypothetical protein
MRPWCTRAGGTLGATLAGSGAARVHPLVVRPCARRSAVATAGRCSRTRAQQAGTGGCRADRPTGRLADPPISWQRRLPLSMIMLAAARRGAGTVSRRGGGCCKGPSSRHAGRAPAGLLWLRLGGGCCRLARTELAWAGAGQGTSGGREGRQVGTALLPLLKEAARRSPLAASHLSCTLHNAGKQE